MCNLAIVSLLLIALLSLSTLFAQTEPLPPVPTAASGLTENTSSSLTLLAPVDGLIDVNPLPLFKWSASAEIHSYTLIVKHKNKPKFKQAFEAATICTDNIS